MPFVFNVQHYSLHDGPGIRTIVFLKGCPMRCRWCCNPESQNFEPELSYTASRCIGEEECGRCRQAAPQGAVTFGPEGKAQLDLKRCRTGLAYVCPSRAIRVEGRPCSIGELLDQVEQDAVFYARGEGGLTVSGGEPLAQGIFLLSLLREARARCLSTAMETCGYGEYPILREAAGLLDTVYYDIKSLDDERHQAYTGRSNTRILRNFRRLRSDFPQLHIRVRTPVIPGFNDTLEDIRAILDFIGPETEYEPLPYHTFGRAKYAALGRDYPMGDAALSEERMGEIRALAQRRNASLGLEDRPPEELF